MIKKEGRTIEELVKEERTAYFREWRAKNKDKVKKHNANYWKRRVEKKTNGNL